MHLVKVVSHNAADEKHLDVVLNRHELGVVDARLFRQLLRRVVEIEPDGIKPKLGLVRKQVRPAPRGVDYPVLARLDALLGARAALVRQDGPVLAISASARL